MLDLVPLAGSWRVVTDGDRYLDLVRHLLQVELPGTKSISVAPPSIGTDEQSSRRRIALSPIQFPPSPDAFHGKLGRVVGDPHIDHCPIPPGVVDPIGKRLADQLGISIELHHLPPGTSKWNKIEHRLFSFITQNWRAKPLVSYRVIVELIGATTTQTGLTVRCELDDKTYPKAIRVSDEQMRSLNIQRDDFHGEWNYTIAQSSTPAIKAVDS